MMLGTYFEDPSLGTLGSHLSPLATTYFTDDNSSHKFKVYFQVFYLFSGIFLSMSHLIKFHSLMLGLVSIKQKWKDSHICNTEDLLIFHLELSSFPFFFHSSC